MHSTCVYKCIHMHTLAYTLCIRIHAHAHACIYAVHTKYMHMRIAHAHARIYALACDEGKTSRGFSSFAAVSRHCTSATNLVTGVSAACSRLPPHPAILALACALTLWQFTVLLCFCVCVCVRVSILSC